MAIPFTPLRERKHTKNYAQERVYEKDDRIGEKVTENFKGYGLKITLDHRE